MATKKIIDTDSYLVATTDQTAAVGATGDVNMEGYLVASAGVSTAGVVPASSATARIYGVITEVGKLASFCTVQRLGVAKVRAGGTIAKDDRITTDANGRGITTTTGGNFFIGFARSAAAAGDFFEVDLEFGMVR